jgi:hypothetical protein
MPGTGKTEPAAVTDVIRRAEGGYPYPEASRPAGVRFAKYVPMERPVQTAAFAGVGLGTSAIRQATGEGRPLARRGRLASRARRLGFSAGLAALA